jgi:hypothetical protein
MGPGFRDFVEIGAATRYAIDKAREAAAAAGRYGVDTRFRPATHALGFVVTPRSFS